MSNYQIKKLETNHSAGRTWPWGASGNQIEVGKFGVQSIDYDGSVFIITAKRGSEKNPLRAIIGSPMCSFALIDETGHICKTCGQSFPNSQGLGNHMASSKQCNGQGKQAQQ